MSECIPSCRRRQSVSYDELYLLDTATISRLQSPARPISLQKCIKTKVIALCFRQRERESKGDNIDLSLPLCMCAMENSARNLSRQIPQILSRTLTSSRTMKSRLRIKFVTSRIIFMRFVLLAWTTGLSTYL